MSEGEQEGFCVDMEQSKTKIETSIYADIVRKLTNLQQLSLLGENHRTVLNDGSKYLRELITIMDEHRNETMDQQTALTIEGGFRSFVNVICQIDMKDLFENDFISAKESFYSYLNLLNISGMKEYFQREEMQRFYTILYGEFLSVIVPIAALLISSSKFSDVDIKPPLDSREIFELLLNYMKGELDPDSTLPYSTTTQLILSCLWNYADKTILVPNLIQVGYPEAILKWISIYLQSDNTPTSLNFGKFSVQLNKSNESKSECIRPSISIIHNISRHDDGIIILNALDAITVIKNLQSSSKDSEINILCCMSLALLLTPEQIKTDRKHMNNALDQLLQCVSNASQTENYKDGGFHISEPLVVLVKLFNDDRALDYILQHAQVELNAPSTVEFFMNLLIKFHENVNHEKDPLKDLTCIALVNILWSISFQEHYQYAKQMKNNQTLIDLLQQFANLDSNNENLSQSIQYVPKYLESIQTAAKGILLNLSETTSTIERRRKSILEELVPTFDDQKTKPMIMISYSHDDKTLCYQLEDELKKLNLFDIWIDKEFCTSGDSWEHIARGIKQSKVVLCLITKNYTSKSVRREVIYAIDKLDKPLLPVFVLKPNVPEWLEIRTCDLTHVRLSDEKQIDRTKLSKLIQILKQLLSGTKSDTDQNDLPPIHFEPTLTSSNRSHQEIPRTSIQRINLSEKRVERWDKENIRQWFDDNGISMELCDLYQFHDGSELLSYSQLLFSDEKTHYQNYSQEFQRQFDKILLPHQFNKFSNSLRKLTNEPHRHPAAASAACILF